jgi:hypothetical protein
LNSLLTKFEFPFGPSKKGINSIQTNQGATAGIYGVSIYEIYEARGRGILARDVQYAGVIVPAKYLKKIWQANKTQVSGKFSFTVHDD